MNDNRTDRTLAGQSLVKDFGNVRALAGVDITIPSGQTMAIMGPSGSGKSTLLHCLSGILAPSSGEVTLGPETVSGLPDAARSKLRLRDFGFVFQDGQLIPELSARENVAIPLMLRGTSRRKALASADEWLSRLGLSREAQRRPGSMSGGQAQRVAIARALAGDPAVIFADEPTGALDQATGHEVMQVLTTTTRMTHSTFIVVTHDPQVAAWCDRLVEIRDGRIHADSLYSAVKHSQDAADMHSARSSAPAAQASFGQPAASPAHPGPSPQSDQPTPYPPAYPAQSAGYPPTYPAKESASTPEMRNDNGFGGWQ
ncbi:ABC transporter ATP-binding protein [Actinomycetaceae bacterium L2_0104]